eukprot:11164920-Alexandrium_andersonii.AAC.1
MASPEDADNHQLVVAWGGRLAHGHRISCDGQVAGGAKATQGTIDGGPFQRLADMCSDCLGP